MRRRALLLAAAAMTIAAAVRAHTPYSQWVVYRKRHLMILASKTDPAAYRLSQAVAATLAADLPDSKARPSRAGSLARLASLIGSKQMDVTVLTRAQAAALHRGEAPFQSLGAVPLRGLFELGDHLLVSRADFPAAHAYLIARTLDRNPGGLGAAAMPQPAGPGAVPPHDGVTAYRAGEPLPEGENPHE